MKILLINPPRWNELVGKNPSIIEKHRGFNPPLGLLYLAASLKKFTNYQVELLDAQPLKLTYSQLENRLKDTSADVVGIPAMTFTLIDAHKTARLLKRIMPQAKIVLGGSHVHLFPAETINLEGVDFALMGEAEFSFVEFLDHLPEPSYYHKIPGLVYKDEQGRIIKNDFAPVENLDQIPFPEREGLDIKRYGSLLGKRKLSTTIISSRGCPFRCAFCDRPLSPVTSHFRFRSAQNVVEEIHQCQKLGIQEFLFYDDTFTVNKERVREICEEIIQRKMNISWDIRTRVDTVDEAMLKLLRRAGCCAIHYGVEAGNDKILKVIKKGFSVKKVKEIFRLTKQTGIETLAYFMIGLPEQKARDIQESFDLARQLNPDYAHFTVFSPYPATELYYYGLEKGIIQNDPWRQFAQNPQAGFKIPLWEQNFKRQQLYEMIVKSYKNFYLRPGYILRRLMKIKSRQEFVRKAKAGVSVVFMKKQTVDKLG